MTSTSSSYLSAIAKRSSSLELERLQTITSLLFAVLEKNSTEGIISVKNNNNNKSNTKDEQHDDVDDDEKEKQQTQTVSILHNAVNWACSAPRFIYLASPSKLIRSADRGKTWKSMPLPSIFETTTATATSTTSKPPKILKLASCSETGAVAFSGTQSIVGLSLKIGGPFQIILNRETIKEKFSSSSSTTNSNNTNNIISHLFFDASGSLLFVGSSSFLFVYVLQTASWVPIIVVVSENASSSSTTSSSFISCATMLRDSSSVDDENELVEIGVFFGSSSSSSNQEQQQQQGKKNNNSNNNNDSTISSSGLQFIQVSKLTGKVSRKLSVPHKLGSVLQCQEISIFQQQQTPPSQIMRRLKWCSRWRPNQQQQQQTQQTQQPSSSIKSKIPQQQKKQQHQQYDYTIGAKIAAATIPQSADFFSVTNNNFSSDLIEHLYDKNDPFVVVTTKKNNKPNTTNNNNSNNSSSDDDEEDDDDTFRGGLFPQTAPRLFACYSTGGKIVDSDCTSYLWVWMGDATTTTETTKNSSEETAAVAAIYSTATNVSFLPLVQTNNPMTGSTTVGLSVLDHGRSMLRASINGVSTSYDGGRTWTEPQLSCCVRAIALDNVSHLAVCSRPAIALLPELEEGAIKKPQTTQQKITTKSQQPSNQWCMFPLPASLNLGVMSDVCIL